jgi:gluconate 2-dehydrogenase
MLDGIEPMNSTRAMTTRPKVLIAHALADAVIDPLRAFCDVEVNDTDRPLPAGALRQRLQDKDGALIATTESIDATLLAACPRLRALCTMAVGHDNIDVAACSAAGVRVSNAPGVLTETTADFGFALMMAAARSIGEGERFLRSGAWTHWRHDLLAGGDVYGTTLGVLGMGRIGSAIARRAALGFGMRVIYHNHHPLDANATAAIGGARWVDKATLLREADHLVIVVPHTAETHHAIGAAELAQMKPTATLTNIARGGVVDDAALAQALHEGRLAAAGLDVFEGEPAVHPALLSAPNTVLTPHIGSASQATRWAMAQLAADNLVAALQGQPMKTPLN